MCGIYMTNIPFRKEEVIDKLKSIEFRGPDNMGYKKINDISIGHVRLSILDLDHRSNQPFTFKNFNITYNGEIYNFKDIKQELENLGNIFETTSDTEVLLKGYAQWGEKILDKLNGMFAFAIYDSEKGTVFCARDRLGVKPFYYYWKEGKFEICSQLKPLMNKMSKISEKAISIYLDCGYIPSPFSIIEDIYKLQPGFYLKIDLQKNHKELKEYWNLKNVETLNISYDDAKNKLHELIIDAVKIRLQTDVSFGSFLSGGIDSALVSAIAAKSSSEKISTFTIGFEDPKYDESKIASQFSKIIDTNHTEFICGSKDALKMIPKFIEIYDEPFADSSALPSLLLNSITKTYVTVALSGDGGDESFFGSNHFDTISKFKKLSYIPFFIRKSLSFFIPEHFKIKTILRLKNENEFIKRIFIGGDSLCLKRDTSWVDEYYGDFKNLAKNPLQKAADLNITLWLENDSNVKVDRASMAFSVESRSPFLDYRIIEFSRQLPIPFRYHNEYKKIILKDILGEYIPPSIFDQPKKGFSIPIADWLRTDLKSLFFEIVNDEFLDAVPNLNKTRCINLISQHFDQNIDKSVYLWRLLVLGMWLKQKNA